MQNLNESDLVQLIQSVFPKLSQDRILAILVDIPNESAEDNLEWKKRRIIAQEWATVLKNSCSSLALEQVKLVAYPSVGSNNADLPSILYEVFTILPEISVDLVKCGTPIQLDALLRTTQIFLAPTEYSTTAPLKIAARQYPIRGATMPGFCSAMIPSLKLNYQEIGHRVDVLKNKLDAAKLCNIVFTVDEQPQTRKHVVANVMQQFTPNIEIPQTKEYHLQLDLDFRQAHASSGRFPNIGMVGNLPSGEAYIVPHEGDRGISQSFGQLPVQFGNEVVVYEIRNNRAVAILTEGEFSSQERQAIQNEPAYANIAELGLGVLADFGIKPIGEILLDEKLGLHIAFGRSDHFGGIVSAAQFSTPKAVIHIDRIYIPELQPKIHVDQVTLIFGDGQQQTIMKDGKYSSFF